MWDLLLLLNWWICNCRTANETISANQTSTHNSSFMIAVVMITQSPNGTKARPYHTATEANDAVVFATHHP